MNGAARASRELVVCASLLQDSISTVLLKSPGNTGAVCAAEPGEL